MRYLVEHSARRQSYEIFDMANAPFKGAEKLSLAVLTEDQMDAAIEALMAYTKLNLVEIKIR